MKTCIVSESLQINVWEKKMDTAAKGSSINPIKACCNCSHQHLSFRYCSCTLSVAFSCLEEKEKPRFGALQYKFANYLGCTRMQGYMIANLLNYKKL